MAFVYFYKEENTGFTETGISNGKQIIMELVLEKTSPSKERNTAWMLEAEAQSEWKWRKSVTQIQKNLPLILELKSDLGFISEQISKSWMA